MMEWPNKFELEIYKTLFLRVASTVISKVKEIR